MAQDIEYFTDEPARPGVKLRARRICKPIGLFHVLVGIWTFSLIIEHITVNSGAVQWSSLVVIVVNMVASFYIGVGLWQVSVPAIKFAKTLFALQLIQFAFPFAVWAYYSAASVSVGWLGNKFYAEAQYGGKLTYGLFPPEMPHGAVVNLFAVGCWLLLRRALRLRRQELYAQAQMTPSQVKGLYAEDDFKSN